MNALTVNSTDIVSWGVLEPVRRHYDMWLDDQPVTLTPPSAVVPPFEACSACPKCDLLAVHLWREPRILPPRDLGLDDALAAGMSKSYLEFHILIQRSQQLRAFFVYDESRFSVVRQCAGCGHEWGQA